MEKYFDEPPEDPDKETLASSETAGMNDTTQQAQPDKRLRRSNMVLKDELWSGQEHGTVTETIAHSRYLRSLCEKFSTSTSSYGELRFC